MRVVLLGGAPGVGKSTVAEALLAEVADGELLVQWVDVDALWRHQPWRVDDVTTAMVRANLAAVASSARSAGVDVLVVTWVFQSPALHDVAVSCLPPGVDVETVQLVVDEATWRRRVAADPSRPALTAFYEDRYAGAQATPVRHVVDTSGREPRAVARELVEVLGLGPRR